MPPESRALTQSPTRISTLIVDDGDDGLAAGLRDNGFVRLEAARTLQRLGKAARGSWDSFAGSWDDLGEDRYMADGGRYRRRRHATFEQDGGQLRRNPHQPHYQSRDYNRLNGDVQRWFEPVRAGTAEHPVSRAIFDLCLTTISNVAGPSAAGARHIEFHQFRIETSADEVGRPTPEGLHRDGVDWVFVMLVRRENVREGVTEIGSPTGETLGRFLLESPGDAVFLDDHRIFHGVTEIQTIDSSRPAFRDVLVVTFTR